MATLQQKRFALFLLGVCISIVVGTALTTIMLLNSVDVGWGATTVISVVSILPAILFGLPYLNGKFSIAYDKETGLQIKEEKTATKGKQCPTRKP